VPRLSALWRQGHDLDGTCRGAVSALSRQRLGADEVNASLRRAVLERDGCCVLLKLDPSHFCRTVWGEYHDPRDLDKLTIEHVHVTGSMMGKRAPDTLGTMVAMCGYANVAVPSRAVRDAIRDYLRGVAA